MKIVCATNMPFAQEAFSRLGEVEILPPKAITRERVRDADLLAIRSTTRVDRALLDGSRVRFVGTATIGTDHMDLDYLDKAGIVWCSAAGCNANSVAEYLVAVLLRLAVERKFVLAGRTLAVIGVGNVGKLVVQKASALGLRVLQNDPPRRAAENNPVFQELDEILPQADFVTLHTPLTKAGPYPTWHLADEKFFARLKPGAVFINASRGGVQDSNALLAAIKTGRVAHAVLDVWEGEPVFRPDVLAAAAFATPHIAGHSYEGKVMGTVLVYQAACRFLGRPADWNYRPLLPPTAVPEIVLENNAPDEHLLERAVRRLYDIARDDAEMRKIATLPDKERGAAFEALRQNYPVRREFNYTRITGKNLPVKLLEKLRGIGFQVCM